MIDENTIESIRKQANIIDIISGYLPLTQKGKNYFGVCPFHEDHSPSMSVSAEKQIYKCFSCGASGNVFTFVSEYENVKFLEAVKIVADKCGYPLSSFNFKERKGSKKSQELEIMNLALLFYQNNINSKEGLKAKAYLKTRGIDDEAIKEFDIGLAIGGNFSLANLLLNKKYDKNILLNLGLIKDNNNYINDLFINRIMFPIHNLDGDCVGFTGRIYNDENQAKYLNSRESSIFKKGEILFNYHRAKAEAKRKKELIIVEGNMDAIRLSINGFKNVVALMGTSMTKEQISIIKNLRVKVILMLDNDSAGEIATYQNGNLLMANNINFFVVRLSNEKDPDEYIIKNGAAAMKNNISNPLTFLEFKLEYFKKNKDLSKPEDLALYIKEILKDLNNVDDLTKDLTIRKIAEEYNLPLDLLQNELNKNKELKNVEPARIKKNIKKDSKYDLVCKNILFYMINDEKYISIFQKELGYFKEKKYRDIANEVIYYYELHKQIDMASFITFVTGKDLEEEVLDIIRKIDIQDLELNYFNELIVVAKQEMIKEEIKNIKQMIMTSLDANEKIKLGEKLIELKKGCVGNEK